MGSLRRCDSSTSALSGPRGVSTATRSHTDTAASTAQVVHSGSFVSDHASNTLTVTR